MTITLIRGYTNCGFEAWTVPCLYVAGKYMRIFAIKADEGTATSVGSVTNFDDFNPEAEKNEKEAVSESTVFEISPRTNLQY